MPLLQETCIHRRLCSCEEASPGGHCQNTPFYKDYLGAVELCACTFLDNLSKSRKTYLLYILSMIWSRKAGEIRNNMKWNVHTNKKNPIWVGTALTGKPRNSALSGRKLKERPGENQQNKINVEPWQEQIQLLPASHWPERLFLANFAVKHESAVCCCAMNEHILFWKQ